MLPQMGSEEGRARYTRQKAVQVGASLRTRKGAREMLREKESERKQGKRAKVLPGCASKK